MKALIAGLTARLDGINEKIDTQRQEGKERGDKIVGLLEHTANLETRVAEMERHVHNECVWGNGEITKIKVSLAEISTNYNNINASVTFLTKSVDKMKTYIVWIIAGSVIGGGAASGFSEILLKSIGG